MSVRSGVPLDQLRAVVMARMANVSLRGVAREVGMSPSGLQKFVDGSVPYLPTRQKLERWYVREASRGEAEMSADVAAAALGVLVSELTPARRRGVVRRLVREVRAAYDAEGPPPPWLDELAREVGPDPG